MPVLLAVAQPVGKIIAVVHGRVRVSNMLHASQIAAIPSLRVQHILAALVALLKVANALDANLHVLEWSCAHRLRLFTIASSTRWLFTVRICVSSR